MSKINVFPNTVIQTNGDTPYILKTIERTASLNEVFIESKTNDAINIDMQDIEFSGVSIKGGSEIGETTLLWVRNSMNVQPWTLVDNRILTCTDELKETYLDELQFLISRGYNIDIPVTANYLRFTARDNSVNIRFVLPGVFEYKKNGEGDWVVWEQTLTLQPDEYIDIIGYGFDNPSAMGLGAGFSMTGAGKVEASGDITSLLNGEGGDVAITNGGQFQDMFRNCSNLITAPNLPSTTLSESCYGSMFAECSNLTTAPKILPATTLASYCYYSMYYNCTSLTTTPELPATTLATRCYDSMFYGCWSLEYISSLPATKLAEGCYVNMFNSCSKLSITPELPATTLAISCYASMFSGSGITTAPELPATTLTHSCYSNMFYGCSWLRTAPELPATTLAPYCYYSMFFRCYNLTTAPELPATTLTTYCYYDMFNSCSKLNYVKISAETPSPLYMENWLADVAPTGTLEITNDILEVTLNNINSCPPGWNVVRSSQSGLNLTLDLNNEWSRSNITNPDPTNYDMYMSASNWHVNSSTSSMYFVVQSNQDSYDFNFLAIVDAEYSYDKGLAYEPDSSSAPHTNIGYGDGDGDITYYNNILYNLEGSSEKRIKVSYIKDISDYSGNDRVFILVPKGTPFINEYVG